MEPLIVEGAEKRKPLFAPYYRGGRRIHIGVAEFAEDWGGSVSKAASALSTASLMKVLLVNNQFINQLHMHAFTSTTYLVKVALADQDADHSYSTFTCMTSPAQHLSQPPAHREQKSNSRCTCMSAFLCMTPVGLSASVCVFCQR